MCREQDKSQRWARCAGSLHASLSSPLGIASGKGKGGTGDHRGMQGPGSKGEGRQGEPAVGFTPLELGCRRVGRGLRVQSPLRHQRRERSISSCMEKGGSPDPTAMRQPCNSIHPAMHHSQCPHTDWHQCSRWLCGDLQPLRIN